MLMQLGPVTFDAIVSNLTETDLEVASSFARHDVVGGEPIYEAMGGAGDSIELAGVIHPTVFGVNGAIAKLEAAKQAQLPLPLMRGTFEPLGWVVIDKLKRGDRSLSQYGYGREISFSVSLLRVGTPAASLATSIIGLFAQ
jgi:phage protein U